MERDASIIFSRAFLRGERSGGGSTRGTLIPPSSPCRAVPHGCPLSAPLPSPELLAHLQHRVARDHKHLGHVVGQHLAGIADVHSCFWGWGARD